MREGVGAHCMLADGCFYLQKQLNVLLHLSPINSCLPPHLFICLRLSIPLSLTTLLSRFFTLPASYFSWFIVRQGVSVRPRLPLWFCEGGLLFMAPATINHVFQRCERRVGENHGRWTDDAADGGGRREDEVPLLPPTPLLHSFYSIAISVLLISPAPSWPLLTHFLYFFSHSWLLLAVIQLLVLKYCADLIKLWRFVEIWRISQNL